MWVTSPTHVSRVDQAASRFRASWARTRSVTQASVYLTLVYKERGWQSAGCQQMTVLEEAVAPFGGKTPALLPWNTQREQAARPCSFGLCRSLPEPAWPPYVGVLQGCWLQEPLAALANLVNGN